MQVHLKHILTTINKHKLEDVTNHKVAFKLFRFENMSVFLIAMDFWMLIMVILPF